MDHREPAHPIRLSTAAGKTAATVALFTMLLLVVGCPPPPPGPYNGPTLKMTEAVSFINRNNSQIPTLWARHSFEANVVDQSKNANFLSGEGVLLYKRPGGFLMTGNKTAVGRIFEVGTTPQHYWMRLLQPDPSRLWFGEFKNLGRPCVEKLPIEPHLLGEVLAVGTIGTDFSQLPTPVMRFNPDHRAYMFVWVAPGGGPDSGPARLVAQREVWYRMDDMLPILVILFDENGRPVVRANLKGHQPIDPATAIDEEDEEVDAPPRPATKRELWPKIATRYEILFPESGSKLDLTLEQVRIAKEGVPAKRGIVFPGGTAPEAGVKEVIKLDRNCDPPSTNR